MGIRAINNVGSGEWSSPASGSPHIEAGTTPETAQPMELSLYSRCTGEEYEAHYDENGNKY